MSQPGLFPDPIDPSYLAVAIPPFLETVLTAAFPGAVRRGHKRMAIYGPEKQAVTIDHLTGALRIRLDHLIAILCAMRR